MDILQFLDYAGVCVFAISGALVAARLRTDIIGFALLATITGIGGGTLRDLILGRTPVFWVSDPSYLWICGLTSIVVFFLAHYINERRRALIWADALGLAVFTVVGTRIALEAGASPTVCVLMGMMTATFGGIFRDALSGQESLITKKEIYATATFFGACLYIGLMEIGVPVTIATWSVIAATFALRGAAIIYDLRLPGYKWIRKPKSRHKI